MKTTIKLVMTSIALVAVLAGCQSMATQPTSPPDIAGTDVQQRVKKTLSNK